MAKKLKQLKLSGVSKTERQESVALMEQLRRDGQKIAKQFNLKLNGIMAEKRGVNGHYGICYSDGLIKIRLRHAVSDKPLKYSALVNTLVHELAHIRHFNHGERFKAFYLKMLYWAKDQGIYCPQEAGQNKPTNNRARNWQAIAKSRDQLNLF